jgi:hypothetical protein
MFTVPRVNVIESDEGFSVQVLGRTGMRYREGGRSVLIDSEVLAPGKGIAVFVDSIKNWQTRDGEKPVTTQERKMIVARIEAAIALKANHSNCHK